MASNEESLLKTVPPEDVFNLPLYEHYLVIDTRSRLEYLSGHIATAVSYPPHPPDASQEDKDQALVSFAKGYAKEFYKPENPSPLVIYGNDTLEDIAHTKWLAEKLSHLKRQRRMLTLYSTETAQENSNEALLDDTFDPFESFCQTVIDKVREIWLLEGGYKSFLSEYPYLCGNVKFEDMFPVPHQIAQQIFMGSRVVPTSSNALSTMGITHMVVSEYQDLDWSELDSVIILRCPVRNSNNEDMIPCWEACCKFIDETISSGGKIMILLHGRSRSASVILAYLIRKLGVGFESAWEHLRSKCWHLIDRSLVYEPQLDEWARFQTHSLPER